MKLIEGTDYFVRYWKMPPKIYSFIRPNSDGTFSIYLNPNRSFYQQKDDVKHEIDHILNEDFYNGKPLYEVEDYL